jgi:ABC-type transport system substrate-binding protein
MTVRRDLLKLTAGASLPLAAPVRAQPPTSAGKTLRVAFQTAETGFDPAQVQDLYSRQVIGHILDAPLEYDYHARPAWLRPNTAVALPEVSADFRMFTFRLRPGILFQDDPAFNGKPRELVAADYIYSWKRIYDPRWKSPMLFVLENSKVLNLTELRAAALKGGRFDYDTPVEGLRALDRYTLQVRLAEPDPRFIWNFADASLFGAVAREVVDRYGEQIMAHPVGTGPYRLAAWRRSSRIVLERNPTYREERYDFEAAADAPELAAETAALRGQRLPLIDRVEVSVIEESQPRWLAFLQGELDVIDPMPVDLARIATPNGKLAPFLAKRQVKARFTPMADIALSYFNIDDPQVGGYTPARVALRRAVALAFDNRELIRSVYSSQALPAASPFVPGTFGHDPAYATAMAEFNPARARALLDTFGWLDRNGDGWRETPEGQPFALQMASTTTQRDRATNELWRKFMAALGIRIEFRFAPWPELVRMSMAGELMMWSYAWQMGGPDSGTMFGMAYGPNKQSINDARFDLPAFNRLFEQQRVLPDGAERLAVLREGARWMTAYMPYLLHLHRIYVDLAHPWVSGWRRHPFTTRQWCWMDLDAGQRERRT